jgi:hypothetical protein
VVTRDGQPREKLPVISDDPQPIPAFEVPENPLVRPATENPRHRTRPVRRVRPRPEAIGELMPGTAVEIRRRELERHAAIAEDIERTAE